MTWTYNSPFANDKDTVRYLVADTDSDDPLATDEEILWQLTQTATVSGAAVAVAEQIARKFARYATVRSQDTQVDWSARATQYRQIVIDLREQLQSSDIVPYAGGISISEKDTVEEDTDRVRPAFTVDLHDVLPSRDDREEVA